MAKFNKKYTLSDYIKVYKKRFSKLDKKTKIQLVTIVVLVLLIIAAAITALTGRGKKPASSSENSLVSDYTGSYNSEADIKYEDEYLKLIKEYDDVVIPENENDDKNYFRETVFVGDSNTEGLAVYNHLSLQYVLGLTGMTIQQVTTNKCMWFVGYEEPVTIPTAISMLKPRRIIINFGTNNAGGTQTKDFIRYYNTALDAIEKAYPYADIIVSAVLPVGKERSYPSITMQDIDEFNLALAEMCRERGHKFLNTAEVFKDPENGFMKPEYVANDGVHLTSEGYKLLLEYVSTHKYVVKDERPARGSIPTRRSAPYVADSSSAAESSSKAVSSSVVQSSSIASSSKVQSSSQVPSSSVTPSSSRVPSSSRIISSSSNAVSSYNQSSSVADSSSVASLSPSSTATPTAEPTPEVTSQPTTEVTPEPTPEVTSQPTTEVTPNPTLEVTPESTLEVAPESTPESTTVPDSEGN